MFKKTLRVFKDMDKTLFFVSLILIVFGTLNIVTASSREAVLNTDKSMFHYFYKHCVILFLSLITFLVLLRFPTKKYKNIILIVYAFTVAANAFLVLRGVSTRGANNWIDFKVFKLQPSEFAKPVLIVAMAILLELYNKFFNNENVKHYNAIWKIVGMTLIFPVLVFLQKDLGTAIILFGIFIVLFIFSDIPFKEKVYTLLITGGIIVVMLIVKVSITGYVLSEAQEARLKHFFNPCSNYENSGYQVCNAFIAINNGGALGVGIGESTQKYSYIPEPHTDMVFSIIAEENGVIKCSLIFIGYLIILYRILKLSMNTKTIRNRNICLGIGSYIFLHILVNLGGLFGVIPLTGVPLPFLSYGGSFMISLVASLSIVQRIHIEMKNEKIKV